MATATLHKKKMKVTPIDWDGDFQVVHQRYEMPLCINNRSFINTYYQIEGCEPGEYQFISSGLGNEELVKKHAKLVGRDVLGFVNINFIGVRPIHNKDFDVIGTFVQQVMRVDLCGKIPDWYRKKKSARFAKQGILKMIRYLEERVEAEEMSEPDPADVEPMAFNRGRYAASTMNAQVEQNDEEQQVLRIKVEKRN